MDRKDSTTLQGLLADNEDEQNTRYNMLTPEEVQAIAHTIMDAGHPLVGDR